MAIQGMTPIARPRTGLALGGGLARMGRHPRQRRAVELAGAIADRVLLPYAVVRRGGISSAPCHDGGHAGRVRHRSRNATRESSVSALRCVERVAVRFNSAFIRRSPKYLNRSAGGVVDRTLGWTSKCSASRVLSTQPARGGHSMLHRLNPSFGFRRPFSAKAGCAGHATPHSPYRRRNTCQ